MQNDLTFAHDFIGRDFKWKLPETENTFAATPPKESLSYIFSPNAQEGTVTHCHVEKV